MPITARKPRHHTKTNLATTAGRSDSCAMRLANFDLAGPPPPDQREELSEVHDGAKYPAVPPE